MGRQKDVLATIEEHLRIRNKLVRQALAECLGTLILVVSLCWGVGTSSWCRDCASPGTVLLGIAGGGAQLPCSLPVGTAVIHRGKPCAVG